MEKKIEEKGGKKEEEVGDFFFQAEDGIRDRDVTGVQTCALPISEVKYEYPPPFITSLIFPAQSNELKA